MQYFNILKNIHSLFYESASVVPVIEESTSFMELWRSTMVAIILFKLVAYDWAKITSISVYNGELWSPYKVLTTESSKESTILWTASNTGPNTFCINSRIGLLDVSLTTLVFCTTSTSVESTEYPFAWLQHILTKKQKM